MMERRDHVITWHSEPQWTDADGQRILIHAFTGFLDAGLATGQATKAIMSRTSRLLAQFDLDEILDYRARRPPLTYVNDHFSDVEWPSIAVHEVTDDAGRRVCVLTGPEPDYRWQGFIDAVLGMIDRFDIELTVGLSAVPWPAPHTRPVGVTIHGTDPRLLPDEDPMLGTLQVPGHIGGLLELRLGQSGRDAIGIAAQVPHYLAQVDYPRAAITMLDALRETTGVTINTEGLQPAADRAEAEISGQLEQSEEFAAVLAALEQQYDQVMSVRQESVAELPTADELAAQVEQFLAHMDATDRDSRTETDGDDTNG
jgi:hypothetical protein